MARPQTTARHSKTALRRDRLAGTPRKQRTPDDGHPDEIEDILFDDAFDPESDREQPNLFDTV